MFWVDKTVDEIIDRYKEKIDKGEPIIIRDEKTSSGRVHVGSLRGVAVHGAVSEVLTQRGINNTFYFEINDIDPMDGLPIYLDEEKFKPYMGKPLYMVPSPDDKAENFAEYFGEEFRQVIKDLGFNAEFIRASDLYKEGKYNEAIEKVLDNREKIIEIYKKVSNSEKDKDWYPLSVICENCGNVGTTKVTDWDGEKVTYTCGDFVDWAEGCSNEGEVSPFDGNAKLPWKVEWAAKFLIMDVDVEGAGKDHMTKGGARDIADAITRQVFEIEPPYRIPYEWLNVEGRSMSSSKGRGASAREMTDLMAPEILRLLMLYKKPNQAIEFVPDGDTVPFLYDTYDRFAQKYFEKDEGYESRVFTLLHPNNEEKLKERFLPKFSQIVFLSQMPHLDPIEEIEKQEGIELNELDKKEIEERIKHAKNWLENSAPDSYIIEIKKEVTEEMKNFSDIQKEALGKLAEYVKSQDVLVGQSMHEELHKIKEETNIEPKEFFGAIYMSILGRSHGPKAGWFLSVLDKDFLSSRLEEVSK